MLIPVSYTHLDVYKRQDNQFKSWVRNARAANADLRIAIKADATTPDSVIKNVMNSLQDLRENRYNLITSLKAESEN